MKGSAEVAKGRIEEAAGVLTGNEKLRDKGRKDQVFGHTKQAAERGVEKAKASARRFVEEAKETAEKRIDEADSNR